MRVLFAVLLTTGLTLPAFAGAPNINCSLSWLRSTSDGSTPGIEVATGETVPVKPGQPAEIILKDFVLTASLETLVAADGGPTLDIYKLAIGLAKNDASSYTSISTPFTHHFMQLNVGREQAIVWCFAGEAPEPAPAF